MTFYSCMDPARCSQLVKFIGGSVCNLATHPQTRIYEPINFIERARKKEKGKGKGKEKEREITCQCTFVSASHTYATQVNVRVQK